MQRSATRSRETARLEDQRAHHSSRLFELAHRYADENLPPHPSQCEESRPGDQHCGDVPHNRQYYLRYRPWLL